MDFQINYLAVFVSGIIAMIIGALWYGPIFGKKWIALMGFTPERMAEAKKSMKKGYVINFIAALVMAYVLAYDAIAWNAEGVSGALLLAFWICLGYVATVLIGAVLWEGKSWKLYFLNVGYQFVTLFFMALVLVLWR